MFSFDPDKSAGNLLKHGIDFVAAQALWQDEQLLVIRARDGVGREQRWLAIARIDMKVWAAVYTERGDAIRLISVRRARSEEVELYER